MHYRRAKTPGATYFFTVVTYQRQPLFQNHETVALLRHAFHTIKTEFPFTIDAIVVLPDPTLRTDLGGYSSSLGGYSPVI